MLKKLLPCIFSLFCLFSNAGILSLTNENDFFGYSSKNRDREYTNGFRADYFTSNVPSIWGLKDFSDNLLINDSSAFNFGISQYMYTPDVIEVEIPDPLDRPYTGVLFTEFAYIGQKDNKYTRLGYQIGTVGPYAFCDETQTWVHESINNEVPLGWDTQEVNEPLLGISYSYKEKFFYTDELDLIGNSSLALGNAFIFTTLGLESRIGYNIPEDFGRIFQEPIPRTINDISVYGIVGGYVKAVGYDISLDGSMFHQTTSVDKEYLVGEYYYGLGIDKGFWHLRYLINVRSKEFETQDQHMEFGTLTLGFGKKI